MVLEKSLHDLVWRRANARCEYCQVSHSHDPLPFQIDHIIAIQHSGPTVADNLALACYACNHHKGPNIAGFDQVSQAVVPLFHPRRDVWHENFLWKGPELVATTSVGRVTVHVLGINRDHRVALRRSLHQEGIFPPDTTPQENT